MEWKGVEVRVARMRERKEVMVVWMERIRRIPDY